MRVTLERNSKTNIFVNFFSIYFLFSVYDAFLYIFSHFLLDIVTGDKETYEDFFMGMAHFKDIALAHILAFENKKAAGRHLCVEAIRHYSDFVAMVADLYPEYNVVRWVFYYTIAHNTWTTSTFFDNKINM